MASKYRITAGKVCDIEKVQKKTGKAKLELLEDWIFVDIGFAPSQNKSCGVARGTREAEEVTFAELVGKVTEAVKKLSEPLNLLLESPLSMAFDTVGNPMPRSFERSRSLQAALKGDSSKPKWVEHFIEGGNHKGWYYQAGPQVMAGAERLIWELRRCTRRREVRLFEGFAPRESKKEGTESSVGDHAKDAAKLRDVVKGETGCPIVHPFEITAGRQYTNLWPITGIGGWDFHKPPKDSMIPPVVWVPPKCQGKKPEGGPRRCYCADLRDEAKRSSLHHTS